MGNQWDNVTLSDRLMYRVDTSGGPDGCWPKAGHHDNNGYPVIKVDGKKRRANRVSWELANGRALLDTEWVLHRCDNPACINPAHLFLGDARANSDDKVAKGRQAKGETHGTRTKPERISRGDNHYSRQHPERMARGERHGSVTHPERLPRGDNHYARQSPERLARGERVWSTKLTRADVEFIRAYPRSRGSGRALARMFGVDPTTIANIRNGKTWKTL